MTAPRLLLACGSRTWTDRARVATELASFALPGWLVMHGACPLRSVGGIIGSADMLVDEAALRLGHLLGQTLLRRPADWDRHGRAAGPKRNEAMAEEAARGLLERRWSAVYGMAFGALTKPDGGDTGTGGMVRLMRRQGWPVRWVPTPDAPAQVLALHVYTARIDGQPAYPDDLDITRAVADAARRALRLPPGTLAPGEAWAPSWDILSPALAARKVAAEAFERAWEVYVPAFTEEMRASYRAHRAAWTALLARERVVLRCRCRDAERCHRRLVAQILARLGAIDAGELPPAPARQARLPGLE